MYGIPGVDIGEAQTQSPNGAVHGQATYLFTASAAVQLGAVPDGVFVIWVTLVGAGSTGTVASGSGGAGGGVFYKQPLRVTPGAQWSAVVGGTASVGQASTFSCSGN